MQLDQDKIDTFEGILTANSLSFAIVCSRFNDFFVSRLLQGAINCILRHGGKEENIVVSWVPGAYEIPLVVQKFAERNAFHAIITLGVIIQGATSHAHHLNAHVSSKVGDISLKFSLPIIYGIVSADNLKHAMERSGTKAGNRGENAAIAAIEMANLMETLAR